MEIVENSGGLFILCWVQDQDSTAVGELVRILGGERNFWCCLVDAEEVYFGAALRLDIGVEKHRCKGRYLCCCMKANKV